MPSPAAATPMIRQYLELKAEHPDAVLFFRLGDFYEMFFEDAQRGAELLGITLTARSKGPDRIPMAGVPYHSARRYIAKLISHGLRVAICEQVEAPGSGPGIVRREITRVITPGMVLDEEVLDARENNYLAAVCGGEGGYGAALLDGSTGEFHALSAPTAEALFEELSRAAPRELLIPAGQEQTPWIQRLLTQLPGPPSKAVMEKSAFESSRASAYLCRHLEVGSLEGYGLGEAPRAVAAAGAALRYLKDTQRSDARHVNRIQLLQPGDTLRIDEATRANLELVRSLKDGSRQGTLISVLDKTATGMGGRKLARWVLSPLRSLTGINARQDAIEDLVGRGVARETLSGILRGVGDIERMCGRIATGVGNARDLRQLADSLLRLPDLAGALEQRAAPMLKGLAQPLLAVQDLGRELDRAVAEEPPVTLKEGGLIRPGYHAELDTLVELSTSGKDHLARIEARERARTGISSLKVRYNKVFGYFLEVTRANLHLVPEEYERKQTTVNSERFVTPELKDYEEKVLTAEERRGTLEYELFGALCQRVIAEAGALRAVADAVATADALLSLARVAAEHGYVRPTVDDSDVLEIEAGRHPVVERSLPNGERFVPNDVRLDGSDRQLIVITGPNMAGKSTVMRQVALITLLAQVGAFVPAKAARIGLCDRIFTRVGAADDLARGRSTFMVEMTETANILHHATAQSLVILDEIGRGTSTFDGLSIAWAVAEHLHDHAGARTLFATHYHELTELAERRPRVKNASVAVHEVDGRIVFLRKLVDGGTNRSYGIEVARLAGLPRQVVARARELLAELEAHNPERGSRGLSLAPRQREESAQLGLFVAEPAPRLDPSLAAIVERLRAVSVNDTTPLAALQLLAELRQALPPEA
ncbi:MAG TPA: DNA mismatch repair protein MutS [Myxococcaceae bacterium]|nr:DNA mismatch repair protein MutS [Myxococcaceae bacterium]